MDITVFDFIVYVFILYWLTRMCDRYGYACMVDVIWFVIVMLVYVGLRV